jgi:hypothetical protein
MVSPAAFRLRSQLPGLLLAVQFLSGAPYLRGQEEVNPVIRGEVRSGADPLPGALVVLHRVSSEMSGEIDSIQAGPDGSFRLALPRVPDHGVDTDVFFASVRHGGLLYFGAAITDPTQLDSLYLIQAYDTVSVSPGGAILPLSARNLFLDKVEDGWQATDFFQVRNDGDRTLFSPEEGVIWQYPLPASARDFEVGQADLAPDALRFQNGGLAVFAPIPPGERFFLVRYRIPREDFTIPLPGSTEQMEVLVRQPGPRVEFPPLASAPPVELEAGNVFSRFQGVGLVDAVVEGRVLADSFQFRAEWLALLLGALLGAVGVFAFRYGGRGAGEELGGGGGEERNALILAVAKLDEAYRRTGDEGRQARARYEARRKKLLKRLQRLS